MTEFRVLVNFSHGEVKTGFNYYLRCSDTAIKTIEHVEVQITIVDFLVQPYVWCVTVHCLFGAVI